MKYWHKISDSEIRKLYDKNKTWGYVQKNYSQPKWCSYPQALEGVVGCWSLIDNFGFRHKISKQYCGKCEFYRKRGGK